MTNKVYKTAKGKPVDIGALRLQNENVRAVGNMGVNARGDRIDALGNVIDPVNQQVQRRIQKQTNVSATPVHTSSRARDVEIKAQQEAEAAAAAEAKYQADRLAALEDDADGPMDTPLSAVTAEATPTVEATAKEPQSSGLAAAIARAKTVKQELEKTPKQLAQEAGVKKI